MKVFYTIWTVMCWLFYPVVLLAGEGGKEPLHHIADVSKATNFFTRWLAQTYNEHRLIHSIAGLVIMTVMGFLLAYLTEWLMGLLGYKAERMEHKE
ncbi:MAG: hypothetical protein LWW94_03510 [Candidatus Desulfofervidaceae bacterium]|nr:hypothetical protein [Candidatus Desulfofervidaceae bacterium]